MILRFRDTVATTDHEQALDILEYYLQDVANEIIREPFQVTFHGLGPSEHLNFEDSGVIYGKRKRNITVLDTHVLFHPSGDSEEADEAIIRSKLDQVFQQMWQQIPHLDSWREEPAMLARQAHMAQPASVEPAEQLEPHPFSLDKPSQHQPSHNSLVEKLNPDLAAKSDVRRYFEPGGLLATAALVLVSAGTYLMYTHSPHGGRRWTAIESQPVKGTAQRLKAANEKPLNMREGELSHARASFVELAPDNPKSFVQEWLTALRSRDAVAQSSYYAYPVDRYMHEVKVDREALTKKKQASIAERKGLWTVRLDDMLIQRKGESEATVRFVKHFIAQTAPTEILEQAVESRLTLSRASGQWRITSEQDFPL